jgi:hypothetical protein
MILKNNICYLDDGLYGVETNKELSITEQVPTYQISKLDKPKVFLIVSKKHYVEEKNTYSAISLKELKQILKLQLDKSSALKPIQRIVVNKEQDGFDVQTFKFKATVEENISANAVIFPETELLTHFFSDSKKSVAEVSTPSGILFWAHSNGRTHSAYQKGLLRNVTNFLQSIGLPEQSAVNKISKDSYIPLLFDLLESTSIDKLYSAMSVNIGGTFDKDRLHHLYFGPLIVATLFSLSLNAYFYIEKLSITSEIEENAAETLSLMSKKREISTIENTLDSVNNTFKKIESTHEIWNLVYKVINDGMEISRFKRTNKGIELTGRADKASFIINELNKAPEVHQAAFKGDIRKSRGMDSFTILLELNKKKVKKILREKNES